MVNIEELRQTLHDEKMAVIVAKTKVKLKKIERQKAKDKKTFALSKHWTGLKATTTDIARDINPPRSKLLEITESQDRMVGIHALGYLHSSYMRLGVIAMLWLVYVI